MRLTKRNHVPKRSYGLGKETMLATGVHTIVRVDQNCVRMFIDSDGVRFFIDLNTADIRELANA